MGLDDDLKTVNHFFEFHKKSKSGFAQSLIFKTVRGSYVQRLKQTIDELNFPNYIHYTNIEKIVYSDNNKLEYNLKVKFEQFI